MKHALCILLIVVVVAGVAYADQNSAQIGMTQASPVQASLTGGGDFSASAVLWFSGTDVTAKVSGALNLNGGVTIGDTKATFKAKGTLTGAASGDSNTMIGSGWATFSARGTLASGEASGEAITLHGAINLSADDIDLSSDTAGSGTGSLYVILTLLNQTLHLRGKVTGTVGGGFVTPDDPHTMQLDGTGSFTFTVITRAAVQKSELEQNSSSNEELSWNTDEWPQEIREQFMKTMREESE
ncbi:MAG TPA: hypothetical protein ENH11_02590 [Candidatus Acetothermia bacterium]|nr:hypothetical protein [Candidatus Acetothermia bacterium]